MQKEMRYIKVKGLNAWAWRRCKILRLRLMIIAGKMAAIANWMIKKGKLCGEPVARMLPSPQRWDNGAPGKDYANPQSHKKLRGGMAGFNGIKADCAQ